MAPETPAQGPIPRYFTWDEVAQRSGRDKERWLVIDRKVYNISEFTRQHPGGSRVISHYAGQDATVSAASPGNGRRRGRAVGAWGSARETRDLALRAEYSNSGKSREAQEPGDWVCCENGMQGQERGCEKWSLGSRDGGRPTTCTHKQRAAPSVCALRLLPAVCGLQAWAVPGAGVGERTAGMWNPRTAALPRPREEGSVAERGIKS